MAPLRCGLILALAMSAAACDAGGPERARYIQNVHGISDDIAAVRMTRSPTQSPNPNAGSDSNAVYSPLGDSHTAPPTR